MSANRLLTFIHTGAFGLEEPYGSYGHLLVSLNNQINK